MEVVGLWTLGILLPLLELIGRDAPFLLHHRPDAVDLTLGIAVLALGVPALLLLLEAIVGASLGAAARDRVHRSVLAILAGLVLLGLLRKLGDPLAPWILLPLFGSLIWLIVFATHRWPVLTATFRFLAAALPIVIFLFWTSPGARAARATTASEADRIEPQASIEPSTSSSGLPPIVWVVFDELPLLSIIDADLAIDRDLFPSLAAFADSATWYRNATTVWSSTSESVVSMLTGTVAERRAPPTRDRYPDNLLTWLEPTHRIRALESVTSLSPPTALDLLPRPGRPARLAGLLSDAAIVAAHLVAPPEVATALPPIDNRWGGFASTRVLRLGPGREDAPGRSTRWAFALAGAFVLADARADQFAGFLGSIVSGELPGLYFAHIMLPHMPYRYLPSGRVYGGRSVYGEPATAWNDNEWFALETYQRHLLQAGYVDRLVGELVARLEETGLWERAVVVLTSDHGVSHWPGEDRRLPHATDHPDDILRVPLLIRAPGQSTGQIDDRPARTMDALPTIATLLGRKLPWSPDGRSLQVEHDPAPDFVLHDPRGGTLSFDSTLAPDPRSLARKLELFAPRPGPWRWTRLGPYRDLVGTRADDLSVAAAQRDCRASLDQLAVLEDYDPSSRYSPAFLTGSLECARDLPAAPFLVAAVNGVVAGTSALQQVSGPQALFAVMMAEAALRAGDNDPELFLATGPSGEPLLETVRIIP